MHIAEGVLPLTHCAAWGTLAAPFLVDGAARTSPPQQEEATHQRTLASMAGALIFAVTLFPIPVPVAGATSHLCATPVLALLLGRRTLALPVLASLLIQALFFAHGGLTPLGANWLTLGLVGPLVAIATARGLRALRLPMPLAAGLACGLADIAVYVADAGILGLGLRGERPFSHWFATVALGFAPVQVPLAILEGLMSAYLVRALSTRRPALLPAWLRAAGPALAAGTLAVVLLFTPRPAHAEPLRGLDDAVIGDTAASAGRPPRAAGLPLGPELSISALLFCGFGAGLVVGRGWGRLAASEPGGVDAPHSR